MLSSGNEVIISNSVISNICKILHSKGNFLKHFVWLFSKLTQKRNESSYLKNISKDKKLPFRKFGQPNKLKNEFYIRIETFGCIIMSTYLQIHNWKTPV